jgi:4-hydroxybenzoate polyprenyltransferase
LTSIPDPRFIIKLLRIKQWYKNLLVFTPIVFADLFLDAQLILVTAIAFFAFCSVSSFIYIQNDIQDADKDALHPTKRKRPIASGKITRKMATGIAAILLIITIILCSFLPPSFWAVILGYIILNIAYTHYLKHIFIIDVFVIGFGFILRVLGGAVVVNVMLSEWLFIATFLIAIILGFSKRNAEINYSEDPAEHRSVLALYDPMLLRSFILLATTSVLVVYFIYSIIVVHIPAFIVTIPFVLYGALRFLSLSLFDGLDPDDMFKDRAFVANFVLWIIIVLVTRYAFR